MIRPCLLPPQLDEVIWDEISVITAMKWNENNDFLLSAGWWSNPPWPGLYGFCSCCFANLSFESKRKQRAIPVKPTLKNASVDFVQTIGRLYFQRKDNKNLAGKMITHFLEQVRQHYNIPTSNLDQHFEKKLSYKSGHNPDDVKELVQHIKVVQERPIVSDELLLAFNQKLDKFKNKFKDGR